MTDKIQHIITRIESSKYIRPVYHAAFWIMVACFYFFMFSWNSAFREATIIFSAGLLPVAILLTYFFNHFLVPRYLWKKRYGLFLLYSFYTLLAGVWLSLLIVFYALIYILKDKAAIDPSVLHPELQVISLNFIVFFAIAVKQIKRAFFIQQEKNELERKKLNTELKLKEAELKLLKAQIHPHFLFNTLNNLYGLTMEKSDEAPSLVLRLSDILDYILYRCNEKKVLLIDEIMNLQNYIEIEKLRYSEKLSITTDFPEETNNLQIAPLLLLPFVENAFKHGVSHNPGRAQITTSLKTRHTTLEFKIENSKNPVKPQIESLSKGIGLSNVKKRLELLYPQKYKLEIDDKEATFSVTLSLELAE
ncbi:sensor histidine kinase [uncultured Draconibacterium sp.]|uniref:sensor histidine kinase n=1 Tax=uncultured Draconibacterium sp. TaxID=1573823 RepID=UPI0025E8038F|nr:histidine kinase [uncultured Draconibacterium sp.]